MAISSAKDIIEDIRLGKMVILMDDEDKKKLKGALKFQKLRIPKMLYCLLKFSRLQKVLYINKSLYSRIYFYDMLK